VHRCLPQDRPSRNVGIGIDDRCAAGDRAFEAGQTAQPEDGT